MHSKNDNMEIMSNDKADGFLKEQFQSLLSRYQIWLEMKVSEFVFDYVHLLYYK